MLLCLRLALLRASLNNGSIMILMFCISEGVTVTVCSIIITIDVCNVWKRFACAGE